MYAFCCGLSRDDEFTRSNYNRNKHLFTCVSDDDLFEEIGVGHDWQDLVMKSLDEIEEDRRIMISNEKNPHLCLLNSLITF